MLKKIKRLLAGILCFVLLFSLTAFADEKTGDRVKEVLVKVKQKLTVPDLFTQFESSEHKDEKENVQYTFSWNNDDYSISMNVNSDENGNISYYYFRDRNIFNNPDLKRLSEVKKEDAFLIADAFIKKTAPECFKNENDRLVYFKNNSLGEASSRGTYYNFSYKRMKDGIFVSDNTAEVSVFAGDKNNIIVSNLTISYDYSASFEEKKEEIENSKDIYINTFPAEMIYERDNHYYRADSEKKTELIYRIKDNDIGYISAYSGDRIIPDPESYFRAMSGGAIYNQAMKEDATADSKLSPVEIKEIETINGLKSAAEIRKTVENMPYLDFSPSYEMKYEALSKQNERYIYNADFRFENEKTQSTLSFSADARDGKILNIYNNIYDFEKPYSDDKKETLSEGKWAETDKKVNEILSFAAENEIKTCIEPKKEYYGTTASYTYIRTVNGIKYPVNSIGVAFKVDENRLQSFSLNFTDDIFDDPKNAVDEKTAYEKILEIAPLKKIYIKSDGIYKLCYGLDYSGYVEINAFSGENTEKNSPLTIKEYSDIQNHWSYDAVKALADVGIALNGEAFNPDEKITQSDLLRLFASGIYHNSYITTDETELYELMINEKIITADEKNPSQAVKREDAFCYLVRLSGLESVAKLSNIYKTDFADNSQITPSKIGYAAILSGFGVVEGNGVNLNPQSLLTRAEAASLLYKYLKMY